MVTRTVTVDVDIDVEDMLEEIDDQTLIDELRSRKLNANAVGVSSVSLLTIFEEFQRRGDAPQCLRDYLYDMIGRVL